MKLLKNVTVDFASLVDEPANPQARILLYKRAADATEDEQEVSALLEKIGRKVSSARLGQLRMAIKALKAAMDGLENEDENDKEDDMSKRELLKANGDTPEEPVEAPPAPDPVPAPPEEPAPESVSKAAYVALQKKLAETEALAKSERDHRLTTEAIAKAKAEYPQVGDPAVIGPIMKRAAESLTEADVAEITRVFKAASEQLRQSALFGEIGRSGATAEVSATDTLMKMANDAVNDGKAPNLGEALTRVTGDPANRKLVEQYRVETLRRN